MIDRFCSVETCIRDAKAKGFCGAHYARNRLGIPMDTPLRIEGNDDLRFWGKVRPCADAMDCWIWDCSRTPLGYGYIRIAGKVEYAHRWAYTALRADIPEGLSLDHLCRNPSCMNPWHLEPVTHKVNLARGKSGVLRTFGSHCSQGHLYDEANTYTPPGTRSRVCRACKRDAARRRKSAA